MSNSMNEYWGREDLEGRILAALRESGKDLDALTIDDLAPFDHYHGGGKATTIRLGQLAGVTAGMRVLDVGGGLGGPARLLAAEYSCRVTVLDPTESYIDAGKALTQRLGLGDQVEHRLGDGLDLRFEDSSFDLVWTQNSGMNIAAKEQLYAGFHRVLRPGGRLAIQEPMAGPVQPVIFPVMWASDAADSFLRAPVEMRSVIEAAGFRVQAWEDITHQVASGRSTPSQHSIGYLIMGDRLEAIARNSLLNERENRVVNVQAVFDRL
jgi:ubiquinone/menaquinone biosynthesis C-methylase UbiE